MSARKFLDAALQTGDRMLFFTVFRCFQQRNQRLRGSPAFNPGQDTPTTIHPFLLPLRLPTLSTLCVCVCFCRRTLRGARDPLQEAVWGPGPDEGVHCLSPAPSPGSAPYPHRTHAIGQLPSCLRRREASQRSCRKKEVVLSWRSSRCC